MKGLLLTIVGIAIAIYVIHTTASASNARLPATADTHAVAAASRAAQTGANVDAIYRRKAERFLLNAGPLWCNNVLPPTRKLGGSGENSIWRVRCDRDAYFVAFQGGEVITDTPLTCRVARATIHPNACL